MNKRNVGIDLLKLILAIMIIINHSIGHGLQECAFVLYENNKNLLDILWGVCNPAVNIFFLISGYFFIRRSKNKFLFLLESQLIISIIYLAIFGSTVKKILLNLLFPWENWWFITVYMILFILSPYINKGLGALNNKEILKLGISFFGINLLQGYIFQGNLWGNGFSVMHAINMYIIGAILYRYTNYLKEKVNTYMYLIIFIIISIIMAGLKIKFANEFGGLIDTYNNPLVIIQSICLFEYFLNIKIMIKSSILSVFSKTALMVYLITDYPEIRKYIFMPMITMINRFGMTPLWIVINSVIIVFVVTLVTWINEEIMRKYIKLKYIIIKSDF